MATGQTVTEAHAEVLQDEVADETAEKHDEALAVVQRLLRERGVRTSLVHLIRLKLTENGRPWPLGQRTRYAPELVVHGEAGVIVGTVTMGARSGGYLVSLRTPLDLQAVRREDPEKVTNLILITRSGGRT